MSERVAHVLRWAEPPPPKGGLGGLLGRAAGALTGQGAGAGRTFVVEPPTACPPDWVRDGIEPKLDVVAKSLNFGERGWWLAQLVAAAPSSTWVERMEASPAKLLAAADATEWAGALRWGWYRAAVRDRDAAWAEALLDAPAPDRHHTTSPDELVGLLPADARDRRLLALLEADGDRLRPRHAAYPLLLALREPLGAAAARALLDRLRRELGEGRSRERHEQDYATLTLLQRLPRLLPVDLLAEAERGWPTLDPEGTAPRQVISQSTMDELVAALRFRREMHEEFSR